MLSQRLVMSAITSSCSSSGRLLMRSQSMSTNLRTKATRAMGTRKIHPQTIQQSQGDELETLGFIGGGNMAAALARGVIASNLLEARKVIVSDPVDRVVKELARDGLSATKNNFDVVKNSNVIVVSVKPDKVKKILTEIAPRLTPDHLVISIAAGVNLEMMESVLPEGVAVARVMPNTPCLVGELAGAYTPGTHVSDVQERIIENVFGSIGVIEKVPETSMDAVTGLSGSGPAYVFMMIEALADGAVLNGLPRATALQLAAQTVRGAATMVLETGAHPGLLKDQVCSPGGATIAAVEALESRGFRATTMSAVTASAKRTNELKDLFR